MPRNMRPACPRCKVPQQVLATLRGMRDALNSAHPYSWIAESAAETCVISFRNAQIVETARSMLATKSFGTATATVPQSVGRSQLALRCEPETCPVQAPLRRVTRADAMGYQQSVPREDGDGWADCLVLRLVRRVCRDELAQVLRHAPAVCPLHRKRGRQKVMQHNCSASACTETTACRLCNRLCSRPCRYQSSSTSAAPGGRQSEHRRPGCPEPRCRPRVSSAAMELEVEARA